MAGRRPEVGFVVGERGLVRPLGRGTRPREVGARPRATGLFAPGIATRRPIRFNAVARGMMGCGGLCILLAIASPVLAPMDSPTGMAMVGVMFILGGGMHGLLWRVPPSIDEMPDSGSSAGEPGGGEGVDAAGQDAADAGGGGEG